jgi:ribosomal protein S12 methylthiotransferase accessory factor
MKMEIAFPGRLSASAGFKGPASPLQQSPWSGGETRAQEPLDLYLASLGTCAALYAYRFCERRDLETEGMSVSLSTERGREMSRLAAIRLVINLTSTFPEKYRSAIARSAEQCKLLRHPLAPTRFEIVALPSC